MANEQKDQLTSKAMEKKDELLEKADEKLQYGQQQEELMQALQSEPAISTESGSGDQRTPSEGSFILTDRSA